MYNTCLLLVKLLLELSLLKKESYIKGELYLNIIKFQNKSNNYKFTLIYCSNYLISNKNNKSKLF